MNYVKDAEKMMHHHNLPLDYPEFVRAKETAKNASDVSNDKSKHTVHCSLHIHYFSSIFQIEYQKQRKQVINNYRGFQTMDSKEHPVVQHGIKAADLISHVSAS